MEGFIAVVCLLLALGLLVLPVLTLIRVFMLGRQQRELAESLRTLQRALQREAAEQRKAASEPAFAEAPARAAPAEPVRAAEAKPAATSAPPAVPAARMGAAPPALPHAAPAPAPVVPSRPPPAPPPPREPSRFEASAGRILRRAWNWILMGSEKRPEGVSIEYAVATHWLLVLGVGILVTGIGFFLRYSIEHGLIGPMGRVSISLLTGAGLLTAGLLMLGRRYHLLGQGLLGAGLATLYFSVFAAFSFYHLIDVLPAFALMALVTAGAGFMAVRFNSMLIAVLGLLGGYGTPVMLSTGQAQFVGLFAYMLLLGLGVFGIAYRRNWHLLNLLAFACTWALFFAALDRHYTTAHFREVLPFLLAFFALFSAVSMVHNVVNRKPSTLLEVLALLANAGICFAAGYDLIRDAMGRDRAALLTIGLAAFYMIHVRVFLARRLQDRPLITAFIGLASFFLVVTVPLVLSGEWITVSWALEALILLWMAGRLNSVFLQQVAYLLYALLLGRFFMLDMPAQFGRAAAAAPTMGQYALQLAERLVMFGVPVLSFAAGHRLLRQGAGPAGLALDAANNVRGWVRQHWAARAFTIAFCLALFVYLHLELNRTFHVLYDPLRLPVLTLLWLAPAVLLVAAPRPAMPAWAMALVSALIVVVAVKLAIVDMVAWHFHPGRIVYRLDEWSALDAGMRLIDFGAVLAFLGFAYRTLTGRAPDRATASALGYLGLGLLFVYATLEFNTFLHYFVPGLRAGGVSVLWAAFALAFVLGGILKSLRGLRYAGLALFVVTAVKVFFADLAHLEQLYRIVAFIALGVVLLAGSFVYLKYRARFATRKDVTP